MINAKGKKNVRVIRAEFIFFSVFQQHKASSQEEKYTDIAALEMDKSQVLIS
jgi:hypothetical protein